MIHFPEEYFSENLSPILANKLPKNLHLKESSNFRRFSSSLDCEISIDSLLFWCLSLAMMELMICSSSSVCSILNDSRKRRIDDGERMIARFPRYCLPLCLLYQLLSLFLIFRKFLLTKFSLFLLFVVLLLLLLLFLLFVVLVVVFDFLKFFLLTKFNLFFSTCYPANSLFHSMMTLCEVDFSALQP